MKSFCKIWFANIFRVSVWGEGSIRISWYWPKNKNRQLEAAGGIFKEDQYGKKNTWTGEMRMGRKYKYWRQESMKSVSLGRGNRILAMEEGIDFFFFLKGAGMWEQVRIIICCQALFCWLFSSRLRSKKEEEEEKKTCSAFLKVMNSIDQTIYKLSFCTF